MAKSYKKPFFEDASDEDERSSKLCNLPSIKRSCKAWGKRKCKGKREKNYISNEEFRRSISKWLSQSDNPALDQPVLKPAIFVNISELLNDYGKHEWSLRPRIFSILWMMGIPEMIDTFIAEKISDNYIPFARGNLPDAIEGASNRKKFLKLQDLVRYGNKEDLDQLEKGGRTVRLPAPSELYLDFLHLLGEGRFAKVMEIRSRQTSAKYACKLIHRGESVLDDKDQLEAFEKELRALKTLSHRHIVKLVGSYIDKDEALGLLMQPVAEMDLHQYLRSKDAFRNNNIRSFFGCLATALAYVHGQNIRHKDIKPNNVLVKNGQVLLADFGTSRICLDGHLTTNGRTREGTSRYCAPEVDDQGDRNSASDIWSLGCVFLEMATTLLGYSRRDMDTFYSMNGTLNVKAICRNIEATPLWIDKLRGSCDTYEAKILDLTEQMLQEKAERRPTAAQIRGKIMDMGTEADYICHHCASRDGMKHSKSPTSEETSASVKEKQSHSDSESPNEDSKIWDNDEDASDGDSNTSDHTSASSDSGIVVSSNEEPPSDPTLSELDELAKSKALFRRMLACQAPGTNNPGFNIALENGADKDSIFQRFNGLPEDQRPIPTLAYQKIFPEMFDREIDENEPFAPPDHIMPPPFHSRDCVPLPKATMVPSYILAGSNHLSPKEVKGIKNSPAASNVFVYGRLMFPSVLHTIAKQSLDGAYFPDLRRRLVLTSEDWGNADSTVQRASELMTPARLRGYTRWQPEEFKCPIIQPSLQDEVVELEGNRWRRSGASNGEPSDVVGFLITGLSREALRYLDLLFTTTEQNVKKMKPTTAEDLRDGEVELESVLHRQTVKVELEMNTGAYAKVEAHTYTWKFDPIFPEDQVLLDNNCTVSASKYPWDDNDFVRGRLFQGMLDGNDNGLRKEEQRIAVLMQMSYALVGDFLCRAIVEDNCSELNRLLKDGWYCNSPCRTYGSPLQAAAALGKQDMTELLIKYGANVNAEGGRSGTPLIAAIKGGRKTVTRVLLRNGADVFAKHPLHVNALYQAVGHADYALTEMILEHAAWLMEDWVEVCDLAEEIGDEEIRSLLAEYDVRAKHRRYILASPGKRFAYIANRPSFREIAAVVVRKFFAVRGTPGGWKGKRGVLLLVAALNAGASIEIMPLLRKTIGPLQSVVDALKKSDEMEEMRHQKDLEDGMYSEWDGESSDGDEDPPDESDFEQDGGRDRKTRSAREVELQDGDKAVHYSIPKTKRKGSNRKGSK
ncbi:hypothetical protein FSARC_12196 [Fusarium sarcochroum]|uniref:Protein kinase domain-containing protein n=1 Tax=Fusarium sarcochroum TaxID=1208366 RepID=A0A8H4WY90_9HYPO|nr:hypothetical protein FSARC_12196 [Fusarium sarcochroum]